VIEPDSAGPQKFGLTFSVCLKSDTVDANRC